MTDPMYSASVPVLKQMLGALAGVLDKTQTHATARNIDATVFLQARLAPDMFALARQVQIAVDFAKGISARLAGVEVPSWPDNPEAGFEDLQALIARALAHLDGLQPAQFADAHSRQIVLRAGTPKERSMSGDHYLLHYGLPQFFFHVTTVYAIARHHGVEIGKRDYMGSY